MSPERAARGGAGRRDPVAGGWRLLATALLPLGLAAAALWLVLARTRLWYGLDDVSDTGLYWSYGRRLLSGASPYLDFPVEYPPLALPLFALPAGAPDQAAYARLFNLEMLAFLALSAWLVVRMAARLHPGAEAARGHARAVSLAFAAAAAALGAVAVNRYDAAVACAVAAALALAMARRHGAAGVALGLGFALKLSPAVLLPLLVLLALDGGWRPAARAVVGFAVAGLLPFLPFLVAAPDRLAPMFAYHLARPLQLESTLATPLLLGHLSGLAPIAVTSSFGSQNLVSPGAEVAARLAGPLAGAALLATFALCWRRRAALRAVPDAVPLAALATLLAVLATGKVFSPQYLTWLLPVVALVLPGWRLLGAAAVGVLLLTHLEFPARYWAFVALRPGPVALVVARNLLLVAVFALSLVHLWRLPARRSPRR